MTLPLDIGMNIRFAYMQKAIGYIASAIAIRHITRIDSHIEKPVVEVTLQFVIAACCRFSADSMCISQRFECGKLYASQGGEIRARGVSDEHRFFSRGSVGHLQRDV
jgi:hypothetical protein